MKEIASDLTTFILNEESLAKPVNYIVYGFRCLKNDVIGFAEIQVKPSDSTSIVDDTLKDSNMNLTMTISF